MKRILSIEKNPVIKTECWTLIKMAIIQTLPNYENWLHSHMNVYYDTCRGEAFFGSSFNPEHPNYFSDILDIEELEFHMVNPKDIIHLVKKQIDEGYYFVLMVKGMKDLLHEVFVYGYDDDIKCFDSLLIAENGTFDNNHISYQALRTGFEKALDFFKESPQSYYFNRSFSFLMSRIKPKRQYVNQNYVPDFFAKMCNEAYGMRVIFQCSDRDESYLAAQYYYTGISCLLILKEITNNISTELSNIELVRLRRSFFKLYEHRCMILSAMIWYEKKWMITSEEIIRLKNEYSMSCKDMYNICMLVLKLEQTSKYSLINRIVTKISQQYYNEKVILDRYVVVIREWYFREVLNRTLKKPFDE